MPPATPIDCVVELMRASAYRHAGQLTESLQAANRVIAASRSGLLNKSAENFTVPFALTERALIRLAQKQQGAAKGDLIEAKKFKGNYEFDKRLSGWIRDAIKECGDAGPIEDESAAIAAAEAEGKRKLAELRSEAGDIGASFAEIDLDEPPTSNLAGAPLRSDNL